MVPSSISRPERRQYRRFRPKNANVDINTERLTITDLSYDGVRLPWNSGPNQAFRPLDRVTYSFNIRFKLAEQTIVVPAAGIVQRVEEETGLALQFQAQRRDWRWLLWELAKHDGIEMPTHLRVPKTIVVI